MQGNHKGHGTLHLDLSARRTVIASGGPASRLGRRLALATRTALVAILAAACTAPNLAQPPFYRIESATGATLLLMGTLHVGPEAGWQFSPALQEGLDRADSFVLEVDLTSVSEDAIGSALARMVVIESPRLLEDLVSPETAKILADEDVRLAAMGLPFNARKRLKPWYIAVGLLESAIRGSGWSAAASAESVILAAVDDRPILGLETFQEQLQLLGDLSPRLQDMMLRDTLLRLDEAVEEMHALVKAWRTGDYAYFERLSREGVDEMPELKEFYEIILDERNRRWKPLLEALLDDPDRAGEVIFVGVGTLHLVGEAGLVELFDRDGYRVRAISHSRGIGGGPP